MHSRKRSGQCIINYLLSLWRGADSTVSLDDESRPGLVPQLQKYNQLLLIVSVVAVPTSAHQQPMQVSESKKSHSHQSKE